METRTGASGRVGGAVADGLLSYGKRIRVVVRDRSKAEVLAARGAEVAVASLDDAHALGRAVEGAAALFALLPEDPTASDFHGHRRRMAEAIAAAVRASGVPHVVFLSAPAAMLADDNGPAKDLNYAERLLRAAAPKLTVIRASYFQDNVLGLSATAKHEGIYPCFLPSADFAFPTVAIRDVGRLAARLLVEPPAASEIIDLVGPSYSARDMAEHLQRVVGRPLRVVEIPAAAHVDAFTKAGLPKPFAEALAEMFACFASGRIRPQGDRVQQGTTSLAEVLGAG